MKVTPLQTASITVNSGSIFDVIDSTVNGIEEGSILIITSKIISICEGSVMPIGEVDKEQLITDQSDQYLAQAPTKHGVRFTITNNTLIPTAGIDESNGDGYYVLWPKNAQQTANDIRKYLVEKYHLQKVGVVITDSTSQLLRRGTTGIALAHSGFLALHDYVGQPDLFGKPMAVTQSNISGGIAAAAVLAMGEGAERTPLCLVSDVPFVTFQQVNPSPEELAELTIAVEDDLFAPFLTAVQWEQGRRNQSS